MVYVAISTEEAKAHDLLSAVEQLFCDKDSYMTDAGHHDRHILFLLNQFVGASWRG